jgi:hypothetical protein
MWMAEDAFWVLGLDGCTKDEKDLGRKVIKGPLEKVPVSRLFFLGFL